MDRIKEHYDKLIEEGNDPVHDLPSLKAYMEKWDGPEFMKELKIRESSRVLEVGVGTGRLAMKAIPFCHFFTGIDLSPKTIQRAEEKGRAIRKISGLLTKGGRFVLSISKDSASELDYGIHSIPLYPDSPEQIEAELKNAGFTYIKKKETEFAWIFVADK